MKPRLALALMLPLAGCWGGDDPNVDFGGEDLGDDRHAILSEDGKVKMGLTDEYVYFGLSEAAVEEARSEMRSEAEEEGVAGFLGGMLERTVGKALGFRATLSVDEIEDIRWEDGRMRIEFVDPDRDLGNTFRVDDEPVTDVFPEEDVRELSEAFRRLKAERR